MRTALLALLLTLTACATQKAPTKLWTALVVTESGKVSMAQDIKTKNSCHESLCYLQWNKSCEQKPDENTLRRLKIKVAACYQQ